MRSFTAASLRGFRTERAGGGAAVRSGRLRSSTMTTRGVPLQLVPLHPGVGEDDHQVADVGEAGAGPFRQITPLPRGPRMA